jgi:hypothetical protein
MTAANAQLCLPDAQASGSAASQGTRRERREQVVRHVEYYPYPRARSDHGLRIGFTRDISASGMCVRVDTPERVGSLLRVTLREVNGRPTLESIARIVWSAPSIDGGLWIGLSLLEAARPRPIRVRYKPRAVRSVEVA